MFSGTVGKASAGASVEVWTEFNRWPMLKFGPSVGNDPTCDSLSELRHVVRTLQLSPFLSQESVLSRVASPVVKVSSLEAASVCRSTPGHAVLRTGLEPVSSAVKVRCPNQLDERSVCSPCRVRTCDPLLVREVL